MSGDIRNHDRTPYERVRRNIERFPVDFAFVLTEGEYANLKSHNATSSSVWGGKRKPPFAFTEHGALTAASILKTPTAIIASIWVVRTCVRLRQILTPHTELARKLEELEKKYAEHDEKIPTVFEAIRQWMKPSLPPNDRRIGFQLE